MGHRLIYTLISSSVVPSGVLKVKFIDSLGGGHSSQRKGKGEGLEW